MREHREKSSKTEYRSRMREALWNRKWFWVILFFAAGVILSALKPLELADGGAVTYFSLFFIWLITFIYGPKTGIPVSVVFGVPKFLITVLTGESLQADLQIIVDHVSGNGPAPSSGELIRGVMTFIIEYPLACGMLAVGGLIVFRSFFGDRQEKELLEYNDYRGIPKGHIKTEYIRLRLGYFIGAMGMAICYFIADVLFYGQERTGFFANLGYKFAYNISFILIEVGITLLLTLIPAVTDAVFFIKHVATTEHEDPTLKYF